MPLTNPHHPIPHRDPVGKRPVGLHGSALVGWSDLGIPPNRTWSEFPQKCSSVKFMMVFASSGGPDKMKCCKYNRKQPRSLFSSLNWTQTSACDCIHLLITTFLDWIQLGGSRLPLLKNNAIISKVYSAESEVGPQSSG